MDADNGRDNRVSDFALIRKWSSHASSLVITLDGALPPGHAHRHASFTSRRRSSHAQTSININIKPVLNWANVCSPNILRTLRRTMIRFLIELLVRRIWFGQSKLYFVLNWLVMRCKNLRQTRSRQHDRKCRLKSCQVNILSSSVTG